MKILISILALALSSSTSAYAFPLAKMAIRPRPAPSVAADLQGTVDFTAIVALDDCSGALVRFETSIGSDRAMVLTNGHCLESGFLPPGTAQSNVASDRGFDLLTPDGSDSLGRLQADRVLYSTMTKTDVTLYQLTETFDAITKQYGTKALTLSSKHPQTGQPIAVVSGYWHKIYSCSIDAFVVHLKEADYTDDDSIRYSATGCDTIPGTSGSPVIDPSTGEIVGINNTGNENGETCTEDNPCEVDADGKVTVRKGASYAQETYLFYGCLDANNQLNFKQAGCELPL